MHADARALLDDVMDLIAKAPDGKCALSRDDIVKLVREAKCKLPETPMPSTRAIGDAIKRRFGVEAGKHGASVGMYPGLVIKSGGASIAHHLLIPARCVLLYSSRTRFPFRPDARLLLCSSRPPVPSHHNHPIAAPAASDTHGVHGAAAGDEDSGLRGLTSLQLTSLQLPFSPPVAATRKHSIVASAASGADESDSERDLTQVGASPCAA